MAPSAGACAKGAQLEQVAAAELSTLMQSTANLRRHWIRPAPWTGRHAELTATDAKSRGVAVWASSCARAGHVAEKRVMQVVFPEFSNPPRRGCSSILVAASAGIGVHPF